MTRAEDCAAQVRGSSPLEWCEFGGVLTTVAELGSDASGERVGEQRRALGV
jgi:hypothetical protein